MVSLYGLMCGLGGTLNVLPRMFGVSFCQEKSRKKFRNSFNSALKIVFEIILTKQKPSI